MAQGNPLPGEAASQCGVVREGPGRRAKLLFGLAFGSGYNRTFQAIGSQGAPSGFGRPSEEPQIRERGEVCSVLHSWRP